MRCDYLVMTAVTMTGTFRWIPVEQNGPTMPFDFERISAFAFVGDDMRTESAIVVRGLQRGASESSVKAQWVDGYPELDARPGDVITLVASQRPIATISLSSVLAPRPHP